MRRRPHHPYFHAGRVGAGSESRVGKAEEDEILFDVVEALLDAGADTAARDSEGKTPARGVKPDSPFHETEA